MKKFVNAVKTFLQSEDGPTAVEYAVMLALIIVVCIVAIQSLGQSSNASFQQTDAAIQTGLSAGGGTT